MLSHDTSVFTMKQFKALKLQAGPQTPGQVMKMDVDILDANGRPMTQAEIKARRLIPNSQIVAQIMKPLTPAAAKDLLLQITRDNIKINYCPRASAIVHHALPIGLEYGTRSGQDSPIEGEIEIERKIQMDEPTIPTLRAQDECIEQENLSPSQSFFMSAEGKKVGWRTPSDSEEDFNKAYTNLLQDPEFQAIVVNRALEVSKEKLQFCRSFMRYVEESSDTPSEIKNEFKKKFNYQFRDGDEVNGLPLVKEILRDFERRYIEYINVLQKTFKEEYLFDILYWELKYLRLETEKPDFSIQNPELLKLFKPYLTDSYREFEKLTISGPAQNDLQISIIKNVAYADDALKLLDDMDKKVTELKSDCEEMETARKFIDMKRAEINARVNSSFRILNQNIGDLGKRSTENLARKDFNGYYNLKKEIIEFNRYELPHLIQLSNIHEKQNILEIRRAKAQKELEPVKKMPQKESSVPVPAESAANSHIPSKPQQEVAKPNLGMVEEMARIEAENQELLTYKRQKQEELLAYKEKVKQERALRKIQHRERIGFLMEAMDFESDEKEALELSEIHKERLQFLMNGLNKNHYTTLAKIFKCPELADGKTSRKDKPKFSEIESLIEALHGKILEDAHFAFLVPNIKKDWGAKVVGSGGNDG